MNEQLEKQIIANKTLRKDIDEIIQRVKSLPSTKERSIAIIKLQEAVMWIGMDLKRIHELDPKSCPEPYPSSKNPNTGSVIEPTADGLKF